MPKFRFIAAALVLATVPMLASLPAQAESVASCRTERVLGPNGFYIDPIVLNADTIALQLRENGYNVDSVESWGGCVKAYIIDPDGHQHIAFFDPDTLQPLTVN